MEHSEKSSHGAKTNSVRFTAAGLTLILAISMLAPPGVLGARPLYVGGLFELTNHWWTPYTQFFPIVMEYAFEAINNRTDVLADYELRLIIKDTQGKSDLAARLLTELVLELPPNVALVIFTDRIGKNGLAARRLTELVLESPAKVAIVGPSLSDEVTITGQMAPFYNIAELSYTATTASTSDSTLFPTLFNVNQIMSALNPLRIAMLKHFAWSRVGTLFAQDEMSVSQMNMFHEQLQRENMTLVTSAVIYVHRHTSAVINIQMNMFHEQLQGENMTLVTSAVISDTNGIATVIQRFKQYDVRIIFGVFRSRIAHDIFCEAFRQGLYGERGVWILAGPYMYPNWISKIKDMGDAGCTKAELIIATNGHFTLDYVKLSKSDAVTYTGMRPSEVMDTLSELVKTTPFKLSSFAGLVYDTGIALALGLNNSIKHLEENGLELADYNYTDDYLAAVLHGIHEVSFMGVSGPINFDDTGQRIGMTYIQQNFNDTREDVAAYNSITDTIAWLVAPKSMWPGGVVPEDHFTYDVHPAETSLAAFGVVVTLCATGCLLALGFLGFNIYNRNKRFIKMSSPRLNNLIIIGSLLMYSVVFITAVDYQNFTDATTSSKLCMVRAWVMSLGFTMMFGTLFSKTYRVYAIFTEKNIREKKAIKDWHLFGVVVLLLVVDCLFLIPWTALHALTRNTMVKYAKEKLNNNVIYSEVFAYCHHDNQIYWFAVVYIYKGLLLVFGVFLAWETREVKVIALNDSKYIGFCIYNVVVICIFGVPLGHAMPIDQNTLTFLMEAFLVLFSTTACLCILFIPKIRAMNKVQGTFLMSEMGTTTGSERPSTMNTKVSTMAVSHKPATDEVGQLKQQIVEESVAIAKLKRRILDVTGNVQFYKSAGEYVVFKNDDSSTEQTKGHTQLTDIEGTSESC